MHTSPILEIAAKRARVAARADLCLPFYEDSTRMHTFVIVASKTSRPVDPHLLARIDDPDPAELHFVPEEYLVWSNASRTVHYFGWQAFADMFDMGSHWHKTEEGLTAFSGHVWPRYSGWDWNGAPWAQQLAELFAHANIPESSEDLFGIYTAVSLPFDGKGYVVSDFLSLGMLYVAETPDALIISTRASLTARTVTPPGVRPGRDAFNSGWLAALIQPRELGTGFLDVKALPQMAHVLLDPVNGARVVEEDRLFWQLPDRGEMPNTFEGLLPILEADLRKEMRAISELPANMRQIRLSGGKDSRLIAALTLLEGVSDKFDFLTFGLPGSGEIAVSEMIAKRFGLDWVPQDRTNWLGDDFDRTILTHIFQTSGVLSAWDRKGILTVAPDLLFSGNLSRLFHLGEMPQATRYALTEAEAKGALIARMRFDQMGIIRSDRRGEYIDRVSQWVDEKFAKGESPSLLGSHPFPEFIARWECGAGTEVDGRLWLYPFHSPTVARVAQYLPPEERLTHRFHFEIMQHLHEDMVRIPFYFTPWEDTAYDHLPNADEYAAIEPIFAEGDGPVDWRVLRFQQDRALFDRYLLDSSNPIFEVLDFDRVSQHLQREDMTGGILRYLYCALTGAIWMAHGELPARINRAGEVVMAPASPPDRIEAIDTAPEEIAIVDEVAEYLAGLGVDAPPHEGRTILLVTHRFPVVSETFIVDKFLHLLIRGWDVHVLALSDSMADWEAYPEIASQPELIERIYAGDDFDQLIARLNPDLVNFEFGSFSLPHLVSSQASGARSVVSFRGFDIAYAGLDTPGFYNDVWKFADVIHCMSEGLWQRCLQRGCPPNKPHVIIPGGIDIGYFDPDDRSHVAVAGTEERPFRILDVGRLVWKKGHEYAVEALAHLAEQGIETELRIVGRGPLEEAIRFTAFDLGVLDRVTFLGARPRKEVLVEMKRADVLVIPSLSEGFGIAALEAQAMKLPVVCSDAEGLAENVQDMVTGFVVPRRDATLMAERLAMLAADPEMRQVMGEAGRERVAYFFGIAREIDSFEKLYAETLDRRFQAYRFLSTIEGTRPPGQPDDLTLIRLEEEFSNRAWVL